MFRPIVPQHPVQHGKFYYCVTCPETERPLLFAEDESRGLIPYPPGILTVSCHYCQSIHRIEHPVISSQEVRRTE